MTDTRPTIGQMIANISDQERDDMNAARWERGASAMNTVLLTLRQNGREFFTAHDYRVAENVMETLDVSILNAEVYRPVAGINTVKVKRDQHLDAIDEAKRQLAELMARDQEGKNEPLTLAPAVTLADTAAIEKAPPVEHGPEPEINLQHTP